ncbi:hypothetical protein QEH56_08475 [Pelagicoccus enzymogenes]|uniref:hypothetical protein n=1 Tax=Pelagicoccus enzymogenes TaxID=2773457 RepID=UPI00280E0470|nr:hypothetical protein [Pelagicoccus enzymogenes]MDQ8198177.1 hypothetical protein [Pelagicoccus enzymogenes]
MEILESEVPGTAKDARGEGLSWPVVYCGGLNMGNWRVRDNQIADLQSRLSILGVDEKARAKNNSFSLAVVKTIEKFNWIRSGPEPTLPNVFEIYEEEKMFRAAGDTRPSEEIRSELEEEGRVWCEHEERVRQLEKLSLESLDSWVTEIIRSPLNQFSRGLLIFSDLKLDSWFEKKSWCMKPYLGLEATLKEFFSEFLWVSYSAMDEGIKELANELHDRLMKLYRKYENLMGDSDIVKATEFQEKVKEVLSADSIEAVERSLEKRRVSTVLKHFC